MFKNIIKYILNNIFKIKTETTDKELNDNLEKIRELIGEEQLERVLEVMRILGVEFPSEFDVYGKDFLGSLSTKYSLDKIQKGWYESFAIVLSGNKQKLDYLHGNELDKLGYFEFNEFYQQIVFVKDDIFFQWRRNEKGLESLTISKDERNNFSNRFSVFLNKTNEGILSSYIGMSGQYDFPPINSYVTKVESHDRYSGFKQIAPIEQYFELFKYILNCPEFGYKIPESLRQEHLIKIIEQIFEKPINDLVYEVLNSDQSWRYEMEKESIISSCEFEKRQAKEKFDEAVNDAKRYYQWDLKGAEDKKDARLQELAVEAEEYKSSRGISSLKF